MTRGVCLRREGSGVRMLVGEGYDVIEQMVTASGKFAELSNAEWP